MVKKRKTFSPKPKKKAVQKPDQLKIDQAQRDKNVTPTNDLEAHKRDEDDEEKKIDLSEIKQRELELTGSKSSSAGLTVNSLSDVLEKRMDLFDGCETKMVPIHIDLHELLQQISKDDYLKNVTNKIILKFVQDNKEGIKSYIKKKEKQRKNKFL